MNTRKFNAALAGALFLGTFGLAQGLTTAPALAAPASVAVVAGQSHSGAAASSRDFRRGYRDGFRNGWRAARDDCEEPTISSYAYSDDESDYMRGYDKGFSRGFDKGFDEYC
jgi:hypothetical protein